MSDTRVNNSGIKVLNVLTALSGHSLYGISNSELAKALQEPPATINRCLNTLIQSGYATRLEDGRYALGMQVLVIAQRRAQEFASARQRMDEIEQRITQSF